MNHLSIQRIVVVILLSAGAASAQESMPARALQRFGSTKLRHGDRILCLAYSHDGAMLVAGGGSNPVRLWNPKTGEILRELPEPWACALAFSPSGETLFYGGYQKTVRLWNFRLHKETGRLDGHRATIKAIAISPDASLIATGSQDGAIYLWDINTKSKIGELPGHADEVTALAYHADQDNNGFLVSAGSDRMIMIWNPENEPNKLKLKFDAGCGVLALAVADDGKSIYSAGDDHLIRRWDLTGRQIGVFKGHQDAVVSLHLRGNTLITGGLDKSIRFWSTDTGMPIRTIPRRPGDSDALAVTRAGDFLATAGTNCLIRIHESSGKEVPHHALSGTYAGLIGMSLSPDNRRLATLNAEGLINLWDPDAGKLLRQWHSQEAGDIVLAFSPDNKTLACAADSIQLWNSNNGADQVRLPTKTDGPIVALAFSPDGSSLAVGFSRGAVELWDVKSKTLKNTLQYAGGLHAVAWSPDGKRVAAGGAAKVNIWNAGNGILVKTFDFRTGPAPVSPTIRSLAFDPDSRLLAAGGFDGIVRIFDLDATNPSEERSQRRCEGHLSAIDALAFAPDGRTLVTGSLDKTVRLFEAFSGKQIAAFKGHLGAASAVAFAADGRSVFSAGMDSVVYRWDVPGLGGRKLPELTLTPLDLETAWTRLLSEDTPIGHDALWRCIASSRQAIPYLTAEKRLYLVDPERIKKLFRDLDSGHYPTRLAAEKELTAHGRWMEGRYDAAIANPPSLEYKRRIESLKEKVRAANAPTLAQERLRMRRLMLICEQVGAKEAIAALKLLAARGPEEEIRAEAAASLKRLQK